MNIIDRAQAPTPKLFKVLRNVGLVLARSNRSSNQYRNCIGNYCLLRNELRKENCGTNG